MPRRPEGFEAVKGNRRAGSRNLRNETGRRSVSGGGTAHEAGEKICFLLVGRDFEDVDMRKKGKSGQWWKAKL